MDSKVLNFLYLNGFIVLVLVAYLIWRPKQSSSRLKLRQAEGRNKLDSFMAKARPAPDYRNAPESEVRKERQLTIIFQFNGHDFEAYEVLGLAAGSSLETVEKCFQALIERESSDTHEFFRMAYNAIKGK